MAKDYLNDEIAKVTADTDLNGKLLVVETKNFTFPGVNNGNHFYQIKKVDADYAVYPVKLNADSTAYVAEDEPVILTADDTVFFYVRRDLAPYMNNKFQQKTIEDGEVKEQLLLAAFSAYAQSKYSMGSYNILLTDDVSFSDVTVVASFKVVVTPATDGAEIKEDGNVRENEKLVILDNKGNIVATGENGTSSAVLKGIAPDTPVAAGTYKAAYQDAEGKLGDEATVPAFATLPNGTTTTTSTTSTTKATTSTTTTTAAPNA